MGGLAGVPFTGKTGFGAFSHHVPHDGGHLFVLMAPHIGVTEDFRLGEFGRDGQTDAGTACGAAVGGFKKVRECRVKGCSLPHHMDDPFDFQMTYLMHEINKEVEFITGPQKEREEVPIDGKNAPENLKQARLATVVHSIGQKMLHNIASMDFGDEDSTLIILTGIQINMPRPFEDYFQPLGFQVRTKDGQKIDLMEECFSTDPPVPRGSVHHGVSESGEEASTLSNLPFATECLSRTPEDPLQEMSERAPAPADPIAPEDPIIPDELSVGSSSLHFL